MRMRLIFQFDRFDIIEKRAGPGRSDSDYLTIAAKTSEGFEKQIPAAGASPFHLGARLVGGTQVPIGIVLGPMVLLPESAVRVAITAVNLGDYDTPADEILAATKVTRDIVGAVFKWSVVVVPIPPLWILGGLALAIATLVGWLTWPVSAITKLFAKPKCNGLVFAMGYPPGMGTGDTLFKEYPHGTHKFAKDYHPSNTGITNGNGCGSGPLYRLIGELRYELTPTPGDGPMLSRNETNIEAFWVSTDHELMAMTKSIENGAESWSKPQAVVAGNVYPGAVASVSRRPDRVDVFFVGRRGQVLARAATLGDNPQWEKIFELTSDPASPGALSCVARHPDRLDVFWTGANGGVYTSSWDMRDDSQYDFNDEHHQEWPDIDIPRRGTWLEPSQVVGPDRAAAGAVSVVSRTILSMDVFYIAPDGEVCWSAYVSKDATYQYRAQVTAKPVWWNGYVIAYRGSAAPGALVALARSDVQLDLFWLGPGGEVRHAAYDKRTGGWRQPIDVAPTGSAAPGGLAAIARLADRMDIFWIGPGGEVRHMRWDQAGIDGVWSPVEELAPLRSARAKSICAVSRDSDHIDVFWVDPWNKLVAVTWSRDTAKWSTSAPITQSGVEGGW